MMIENEIDSPTTAFTQLTSEENLLIEQIKNNAHPPIFDLRDRRRNKTAIYQFD